MKKPAFIWILFLLAFSFPLYSQDSQKLRNRADSLYKAGNYQNAIPIYLNLTKLSDFKLQKTANLYRIACCYNLQGHKDSAFFFLRKSIRAGYSNKSQLEQDTDLTALRAEKEWKPLVQSVKEEKKTLNKDPKKASLFTDDIRRFWKAYDRAQTDTADRVEIYRSAYFDTGSRGLQDYMGLKVRSIREFVRHYDQHSLFYKSIRNNTLKVDSLKPAIYACFEKLKDIYPGALFPDIYFVMGAFTSAGTVSDAGLLIGINQLCKTDNIPLGELSLWQRNNFNPLQNLPACIAHELIHFEQDELMRLEDTTTLLPVLVEGMADFLGEMISGKNLNQRLHNWAKGKEKNIWEAFLKDMDLNRFNNWIANADQETSDNPADQGYWIGYQICKAYYINAVDKQQAIYDMLHFKDPRDFLKKSNWEKTLSSQAGK
jgi:hypothetical protein